MNYEKRYYKSSKNENLLTLCGYNSGCTGDLKIGSVACQKCSCNEEHNEVEKFVICSYNQDNSPQSKIKKIAADCKKALEDGVIKFEQLEGILKNKSVEKSDNEIICNSCKNRPANRFKFEKCMSCENDSNFISKNEKSVEEKVFELIKDPIRLNERFRWPHFCNFKDFFTDEYNRINEIPSWQSQCLFLAIMKGVHKLIEGDKKNNTRWIFRLNEINTEIGPFYETTQIRHDITCLPDFFYFSTEQNAERARDIITDFFNINVYDWWVKK